MIRIAVDAMGGDFAPQAAVDGALASIRDPRCDFSVLLCGDAARLEPLLPSPLPERLSVVHAPAVVDMHDSAASAWRTKKDSSMIRALELHRDGQADAVISAGHTGVMMSASTLILGRLPGIARPTIGTSIPTVRGTTLLVDAGANVDSKPQHLVQFGIMGSIYAEQVLGIERPSVGLLNVGEEDSKGNDAAIEAHRLLRSSPVNFAGNCEGRDILRGAVDVAVCDGFVGNIVLKFAESVPFFLKHTFRGIAARSLYHKLLVGLMLGPLRAAMRRWDPAETGGVPLLGLNGTSLIGHGNSDARAVTNMIVAARNTVPRRLGERITEAMRAIAGSATQDT